MHTAKNALPTFVSVPVMASVPGVCALAEGFFVLHRVREVNGGSDYQDYDGTGVAWCVYGISILSLLFTFHAIHRFVLVRSWWRVLVHALVTAVFGPYIGIMLSELFGLIVGQAGDSAFVLASFGICIGYGLPLLLLCWRKGTMVGRLPLWLAVVWMGVCGAFVGPAVFTFLVRAMDELPGSEPFEVLGFEIWRQGAGFAWCGAVLALRTAGILGKPAMQAPEG